MKGWYSKLILKRLMIMRIGVFLEHVLERKGFSSKWRSWMRGCLSSTSLVVLVNGSAKSWVKASRGLRQGDPLTPFLFTLVVDVLSGLMFKAEEKGLT